MSTIRAHQRKQRLSFFVNSELSEKISSISKETELTVSDIARKALENFIVQFEKEKVNLELEAGYKANYDYYLKTNDEGKYADRE